MQQAFFVRRNHGIDYAAEQLLSLAGHVQVLEPPELRERLRQLAARVVALNKP